MSTQKPGARFRNVENKSEDRQIGARVSDALYAKILDRQNEIKKLTGIEPSISDVVRMLIERGLESNGKRR